MTWTYPKTWNVGDQLVAADLNTYVRDNSNYLNPSTVIIPTLNPGWGILGAGYNTFNYVIKGTMVLCTGGIKNVNGTAIGSPAVICNGPPPATQQRLAADYNGVSGELLVIPGTGHWQMTASVPNGGQMFVMGTYSLI